VSQRQEGGLNSRSFSCQQHEFPLIFKSSYLPMNLKLMLLTVKNLLLLSQTVGQQRGEACCQNEWSHPNALGFGGPRSVSMGNSLRSGSATSLSLSLSLGNGLGSVNPKQHLGISRKARTLTTWATRPKKESDDEIKPNEEKEKKSSILIGQCAFPPLFIFFLAFFIFFFFLSSPPSPLPSHPPPQNSRVSNG